MMLFWFDCLCFNWFYSVSKKFFLALRASLWSKIRRRLPPPGLSPGIQKPKDINSFTPRPSYGEMICHSKFCICERNPVVLPIKWILFSRTFTQCYLFLGISLKRNLESLWVFPFPLLGVKSGYRIYSNKRCPRISAALGVENLIRATRRCLFEYFHKMMQIHCNRCNAVLSQQWELFSSIVMFFSSNLRKSIDEAVMKAKT